jgi:tRNA 2-thiouridine synthesizing protein A
MQIDIEINARGLNCPLPLMKAKMSLKEMQSGQVLRLTATDSGSMSDILEFVTEAGHEMIEQQHIGKDYIHTIRCG